MVLLLLSVVFSCTLFYIVQFQKISILPHRRDWNFLGDGGFWKIKKYKEMYEALPEFPEGWGGVKKDPFCGGGMDIFWNYTLSRSHIKWIPSIKWTPA